MVSLDLVWGRQKLDERYDKRPCLDEIVDLRGFCKGDSLSFPDNAFGLVRAFDVLEHIDDVGWLLSEIHRVSTDGTPVNVRYPHASCQNSYSDVYHVRPMGFHSLDHFDPSKMYGEDYGYFGFFDRNFPFKIESVKPEFHGSVKGRIRLWLYNWKGPDFYEIYILPFLKVGNVLVDLKVVKQ